MANDSEYSLIAGFWTSNLHEAMKYAPQIRAGSVQVNGSTIHIEPTFGNVSHPQQVKAAEIDLADTQSPGWSRRS